MLYCGFDLSLVSFRTLILSHGFALLDSKSFPLQPESPIHPLFPWIDSFRLNKNEPCLYFFDDWQFNNFSYTQKLFLPINQPDKIYLLPHRHLLDIIQFIKSWRTADYNFNDLEYLLASSIRIFDLTLAKQINNSTPHLPDPCF